MISGHRRAKKTTTCQATIVTKQVDVQLHKGSLFEFCKESGKSLLAVVQKADGKKNWIAADQVDYILSNSILDFG